MVGVANTRSGNVVSQLTRLDGHRAAVLLRSLDYCAVLATAENIS
jgi:hypothetical protein